MAGWSPSGQLAGWSVHLFLVKVQMMVELATYFVDVMVDMLSSNGWGNRVSFLDGTLDTRALELGSFLLKAGANGGFVTMM